MNATATLANQVRYSDQYKMARAESTVSWLEAAFDRAIELLKIEPAEIAAQRGARNAQGLVRDLLLSCA